MRIGFLIKSLRNVARLRNKKILLLRMVGNYLSAFFRISNNVTLPLEMQIEPASICNLHCEMCSVKNKKTFINSLLKKEEFIKLLDNLKTLKSINFTGMGESLMNNDLAELIKIANARKIETMFITNAQLLNIKKIDNLIKSSLDKICISMESGDPSSYEKFRPGAKFEILKKNVELLNQAIKKTKSNLQIIINTVLLSENLENPIQLEKIIDFACINDIKLITLQFPHDISVFNLKDYFGKNKNKLVKMFDSLKNYADKKGIAISFPSVDIEKGSCYYPWVYPQVTADGELLPCCLIPQFGSYKEIVRRFSFGNVFEKSFGEIWNSPRAVDFRNTVKTNPNEYCRKCSKYLGIL